MSLIRFIILILITCLNFSIFAFPIPKDNKVNFDIIRKNKIIGNHEIIFSRNENEVIVETNINIKVKLLFIQAYKFSHESKEIWKDNNFIKFKGHTDFEDEREYFIEGYEDENNFYATGMDGKLILDKNIIPSNFWNMDVLKQDEIFDIQKGIVRKIEVKKLGNEDITIKNKKINCQKYILNASVNPKDKGPFPEYTFWYNQNNELMKFQFLNWKDNKMISIIRNN